MMTTTRSASPRTPATTAPSTAGSVPSTVTDGGEPGPESPGAPDSNQVWPGRGAVAERCGWSLVWLAVVVGGVDLWGAWTSWAPAGWVAPLVVLAGIAGLVATWAISSPRSPVMQVLALASVVTSILGNEGAGIHLRAFYTTDSSAFDQVAARLLQHGVNPYTASLAPAERLLQTPVAYWTYTMDGGHVTQMSYPAGSVLVYLPALALGFRHQIVDWTDLVAWVVTGVLLFVLVPSAVRWFAVLVLVIPAFTTIFGSGGTDAVFLPFMVLAVWRWDRFGVGRSAGLANWMGPVALGLACSIKQTPWFCVPFLVVGLFIEARTSGRRPVRLAAGYLAIVAGVFAIVNLPFIVWSPSAWLHGTLLPLTRPLVIDGQGLTTVVLHGVARGVSIPLLNLAGLLVVATLLAAMVVWYPVMKRIWLLALPLAFFVAPRSLTSYLLDLYPAALVAAITVAPSVRRWTGTRATTVVRRPATLVVLVPAVAAAAVAVAAFSSPPLELAVRSVTASQSATEFDTVTLTVSNTTDGTVRPHFMVSVGSPHPDGFWYPVDRQPVVLGPHGSTTVTIAPGGYTSAPLHGTHWLVEAYTTSPAALSTSPLLFWKLGKPPKQLP